MRIEKSRPMSALLGLALAGLIPTCTSATPGGQVNADASVDAASLIDDSKAREASILRAELRRSATEITPADQQHRVTSVRRAAARALARIGGEESRAGLIRAVSDEDDDVVAWGAYGLGFSCKGNEKATVAILVARASSFDAKTLSERTANSGKNMTRRLDPLVAIARAVGRCASEDSEATLVAWLSGSRSHAIAAALGLGDLATTKQRLREETLAALLNVAAGSASSPPAPEGLFAIGRLEHVPVSVTARLREVAKGRLAEPGEMRLLAVRALGRAGPEAATDLDRILRSGDVFSSSERAEAARVLRRLGSSGQRTLQAALGSLTPATDTIGATAMGEEIGVLLATLEALEPSRKATKELKALAELRPPPNAPTTVLRRLTWIRCLSAGLFASSARDKLLVDCDLTRPTTPEPSPVASDSADAGTQDAALPGQSQTDSIAARVMVEVLDRSRIDGANLKTYKEVALGAELRAREAAIELLAKHEELHHEALEILEAALAAQETGLVASAAGAIASKPTLANRPDKPARKNTKRHREEESTESPSLAPAPTIVKKLMAIVGRADAENDIELTAGAVEALGALGVAESKARLEELCRSSWPEIRKRAAKALNLLSNSAATCVASPEGGPSPSELTNLVDREVTLTLDTDAGQMSVTLDGTLAPQAVTRIIELAKAGYYDGMVVHRVVPGFVTQLGAPHGDGYGGPADKPSLRCETSPIPFENLTVGIALSGRDTGSSQFFVMHARHPHLDGQYAWIGHATGPWGAFVDGDLIRKVTLAQ